MRKRRRLSLVDVVSLALGLGILAFVVVGVFLTLTKSEAPLSPRQWLDLVVFGLAQGSVYALIALGYTLVYGVLFMINFAHGDVFMFGAMTSFFVANALASPDPATGASFLNSSPLIGMLLVLATAALSSMIVAILLERIAYRPLRRAPRLVPLITAIGASLFISNSVRGLYGEQVKAYPRLDVLQGPWTIFGYEILPSHAIVIVSAVILMAVLWWFVQKTKTGRSMRAVAENKDTAALMGINVDRVIATTFAIGGLLAGAAGVLYAIVFNQVSWTIGFLPGIKAFTAAVLGGIGNIVGAMIGGVLLGTMESVAPTLLLSGYGVPSPTQLKDVIAFSVLVLVLIFRPSGLLGEPENK